MDSSPPWRGSLNATRACALAEVSLAGAATAFNFVGGCMKARDSFHDGGFLNLEHKITQSGHGSSGKVAQRFTIIFRCLLNSDST